MWNDAGRGGSDGAGVGLGRGFLARRGESLDSVSDSESEYSTRGILSDVVEVGVVVEVWFLGCGGHSKANSQSSAAVSSIKFGFVLALVFMLFCDIYRRFICLVLILVYSDHFVC